MVESQVRELLGKGLPKIVGMAINSVYRLDFHVVEGPARDFSVAAQLVGSQLAYSRNIQVHAFLILEASQVFTLGQRAFPKFSRAECPKVVMSANGEALNTIMGKVSYLIGKLDEGGEVTTAPPILLNCSGPNGIPVHGDESLFLTLTERDISMQLIASVQRV